MKRKIRHDVIKKQSLEDFICNEIDTFHSIYKYDRKGFNGWVHQDHGFTNETILNYFNSKKSYPTQKLGFYGSTMTNCFIIDIDFHDDATHLIKKGKEKYKEITDILKVDASFIERTKRGFHLYYFLNVRINNFELMTRVNNILNVENHANVEVRGSTKSGTSLPIKKNLLTKNFNKSVKSKVKTLSEEFLYQYEYDFNNISTEKSSNAKIKESKKETITISSIMNLPQIENGSSNEWFCDHLYKFFFNGFNSEETAKFIYANYMHNYTNELKDISRLTYRISEFEETFKNKHKTRITKCNDDKLIKDVKDWKRKIFCSLTYTERKQLLKLGENNLDKILYNILEQKFYTEEIAKDNDLILIENVIHPYRMYNWFKFKGIAVPSCLIRNVNNYSKIIKLLIKYGILSYNNDKRQYSHSKGYCISYVINERLKDIYSYIISYNIYNNTNIKSYICKSESMYVVSLFRENIDYNMLCGLLKPKPT